MTVAHVYLVDQGLDLSNETLDYLSLDEPCSLLLALKGGHVFAYDITVPGPHNLRWTYPLQDGPPLSCLRCCPSSAAGHQLLLMQRSPVLLEAVDLQTGNIFVHASYKGRADILTYFFTDAPDTDLVMVTSQGLELCQFDARRQGLRLRERVAVSQGVQWAKYSHETRMLLLGGGATGGKLKAWQFTAGAIIKLPSFEVKPAPLPSGAPATLGADRFWLLRLYGRVYCAYLCRESLQLQLHRFYTDQVLLQHSYELFSPHVQLSTVDNVLLVHHPDTQVVSLLDACAPTQLPIANPLPPALLPQHAKNRSEARPAVASAGGSSGSRSSGDVQRWRYQLPNVAIDLVHSSLHQLQLDLKAVAECCSDVPLLVGFLQRRRQCPVAALATPPKSLVLAAVKMALQDRLPMATLRGIFDLVNGGYADCLRAAAADTESARQLLPQVVSPGELAQGVFKWLHDEEVVDAPYLQSALAEYHSSAHVLGLALPAELQLLAADILLQQGQPYQVAQTLYCQPSLGTAALAEHVMEAAAQVPEQGCGGWALGRVALDVLGRQAAAEAKQGEGASMAAHVKLVLQRGEVLKAAKLVKGYGLERAVPPAQLLQAAAEAGDRALFAAVYRLWRDVLQPSLPTFDAAAQRYGIEV
jgi:hypothetical protein